MGEIETVEAEKMGWIDLPRGTSYPTFPYTVVPRFSDTILIIPVRHVCTSTYLYHVQQKPRATLLVFVSSLEVSIITSC